MMKRIAVLATSAFIMATTGCGSDETTGVSATEEKTRAAAEDTASETAWPEVEIGGVEDLRNAFVAAGGSCEQYDRTDVVEAAAESADCDSDTVLMYFTDVGDRVATVATLGAFGSDLLAGDNWVINSDLAELESVKAAGLRGNIFEGQKAASPTAEPAPTAELGTRANPGQPEDSVATFADTWEVTVGKYDPDAWPEIQAENMFNDPPADGNVYITLPVTVTYIGQDSGLAWVDLDFQFVTADGRSFNQASVVEPNDLTDVADLYNGGVGQGNVTFEVPADAVADGTFAVKYAWGDPLFFAAVPQG